MRRTSSISTTYTTRRKRSFALMLAGSASMDLTKPHLHPVTKEDHAARITTAPSVLIRAARGSDGPALRRLAALDSAASPRASCSWPRPTASSSPPCRSTPARRIADPFRPTADVVDAPGAARRGAPGRSRPADGALGLRDGVSHTA